MPYPSQISAEQIEQTAMQLVEANGVENVTLQRVAESLHVRSPSLYRYVAGRTDLLRSVNLHFLNGLFAALAETSDTAAPAEARMMAVLRAYRQYAHEHPQLYLMSFGYMVDELRPDEDLLLQMVMPLQAIMAEITGAARSLAALRGVLAFVHGYVLLELTGQLRRGGDLAADFEQGAGAFLAGWRLPAALL